MKVILAGYNIDTHVIEEARNAGIPAEKLTPEVLSAAYARISRNPAPICDLRREALNEVEKARKSNRKIIFGMGHHSVAEHAVFNFDIIGLSRLAIEHLEHFRLCSFTEKSQRYITLDKDYVMPRELADTPFAQRLEQLINQQTTLYETLQEALLSSLQKQHADLMTRKSGAVLVDGWAKEDARYATLLCTAGQLGFTVNARNLELIIKRLNASPLSELRELGRQFFDAAGSIAPSILLFTEPSLYDRETTAALATLTRDIMKERPLCIDDCPEVRMTAHSPDADRTIAAALLYTHGHHDMATCREVVRELDEAEIKRIFMETLRRMEFYDTPPREFEHVHLTLDIVVSAAAYGQLKRHRMMSQTIQAYSPSLGLTIPPAIETSEELLSRFSTHAAAAESLYTEIRNHCPAAAPYALTNAHRRRVLLTTNLRDLYHFCRLREDAHAQWDIRHLAEIIRECVRRTMPMGSLLLCGKDRYVDRFQSVYGKPPMLDPSAP